MHKTLFELATEYVAIIEQIEKTTDPKKLQDLEEKRIDLHWKFIDKLKSEGIESKDRDHATRIAFKIARKEL